MLSMKDIKRFIEDKELNDEVSIKVVKGKDESGNLIISEIESIQVTDSKVYFNAIDFEENVFEMNVKDIHEIDDKRVIIISITETNGIMNEYREFEILSQKHEEDTLYLKVNLY